MYTHKKPYPAVEDALASWCQGHSESPPLAPASSRQKAWDGPRVRLAYEAILDAAPDVTARARLLAVARKESGAWLHALPMSSLGLRMDDEIIRVAVGLRLGVTLCHPHRCRLCGAEVDHLATHGLSCRRSSGRHSRHAEINDIVKRSLASAKIPSHLEPTGISSSEGKRPDGITVVRGREAAFWSGMPPAQTPMPLRTCLWRQGRRGPSRIWQSRTRAENILILPSAITSSPLRSKRLG